MKLQKIKEKEKITRIHMEEKRKQSPEQLKIEELKSEISEIFLQNRINWTYNKKMK